MVCTRSAAAGATAVEADSGLRFTQTFVAAQAALDGQGVAVPGPACIPDHRAAGRSVRLFALGFTSEHAYDVVFPEATFARPGVAAFRARLREAATHALREAGAARALASSRRYVRTAASLNRSGGPAGSCVYIDSPTAGGWSEHANPLYIKELKQIHGVHDSAKAIPIDLDLL